MSQGTTSGISNYNGTWGKSQVLHLLRRTTFGSKSADVQAFLKLNLEQAVNQLLTAQAIVTPPLNNYSIIDVPDTTGIKLGETWVRAAHDGNIDGSRRSSLKAWMLGRMINQERSLEEKMVLFWHNHFSTEMDMVNDARFAFNHFETFRSGAFGNFKKLVRDISVDPNMLVYLNGSVNTKTAPDENYGRELQELFTVGKSPESKYTEDDVKAAARILTGYRHKRDTITYTFTPANHDTGDKQFSAFYGSKVIKGRTGADGEKELDELIDLIFVQNEVAKYICRKLYRYFVYYDITDTIEKNVILPLADVFVKNKYEIKPVLKTLFMSEHFFDTLNIGAMIKSPLDHIVGFVREFNVVFPGNDNFKAQYAHWKWLRDKSRDFSQDPGDPPNVSGWPAYYQSPQFHELWVNADTFPKRTQLTDQMLTSGYTIESTKILVDFYAFTTKLKNPEDPAKLIDEVIELLYAMEVDKKFKDGLKTDILLEGQASDYYWTDAWNAYKTNPKDTMNAKIVVNRLQNLYKFLTASAEYQLS
jgi:uncharacterized protein (DUF1800 family)